MMFFTQVTLAVVLLPLTLLSAAITSESFTRKGKCKSLRPTNWTPCSSSCGSGYSIRIQFVNINKPKGTFCRRVTSRRNCKRGACAASGKCPSEWTSWTACSTTCEGGRRTRRRNRKIGNEGDCYEVQEQFLCNQDIPCSQLPNCIHKQIIVNAQGNLTSPDFSRYRCADLEFQVVAPRHLKIQLTFSHDYTLSPNDTIQIYSGASSTLLYTGKKPDKMYTSQTNVLTIHFDSTNSLKSNGLTGLVRFLSNGEDQACPLRQFRLFSGSLGVLSLPELNGYCGCIKFAWSIGGLSFPITGNSRLQFTFPPGAVLHPGDCLRIRDGKNETAPIVYEGRCLPSAMTVSGQSAFVKLEIKNACLYKRFIISFRSVSKDRGSSNAGSPTRESDKECQCSKAVYPTTEVSSIKETPLSMEGFPSPSPSPKFTPTPKLTVTPTHPPNCPLPCLGNGVVAQPRKETYQLEDAVTCSCEDSSLFILEGMADHLCVRSDSGTAVWSNGGTLRCVPNTSDDEPTTVGPTAASTAKLCQPLANVKGAYIAKRKEEYHVGDVAKYVCRPKRFVIEGNDIVRCVDTGAELGVWIVVPVCRLKADQCQEGPWSPCSQTCGKGEQTRVVERFHGKTCRNETEKRSCQIDTECATPTPVFHPCGGKIGSPVAAGSFSSPGYPVAYPNSMTCEWDIQAEAGQTISIIFATGETEPMYDVVEVWDGDTIMDSLSNVFHTVKLRSKTNKVMVRMVTDSLEQSRGFSATYQIKGSNDAKICSKELVATKKSQKISSPANGVNCTWIIRARSCCLDVTNLEVSFTQLQTKGKEEVIEIRSGATESSPLVGYYHGHVTPGNPIRLKSCFAYVRYWSVPASNPSGNFELNFYVKSS
eukprot:m.183899 g.183899  ORF g.183899 m.183899 type:complete len:872 (+) comp39314_c0_seq11:144-2759(+)